MKKVAHRRIKLYKTTKLVNYTAGTSTAGSLLSPLNLYPLLPHAYLLFSQTPYKSENSPYYIQALDRKEELLLKMFWPIASPVYSQKRENRFHYTSNSKATSNS